MKVSKKWMIIALMFLILNMIIATNYATTKISYEYNILKNSNNVYDAGNNIWNISKTPGLNIIGGHYIGGNYWCDYNGIDINSDGIGDTELPYNSSDNIRVLRV